MNKALALAPLLALVLTAPAVAGDEIASVHSREPLILTKRGAAFCVERSAEERCYGLPAMSRLRAVEPDGDGWIAAGVTWSTGEARLLLLAGGRGEDGVELLPEPPGEASWRWHPVPLVSGGRLAGLAWLEGAEQDATTVWAAEWTGSGWSEAMPVAGRGQGPQLALDGAVLEDGRTLLVWAAYDGADDEIVYSVGRRGRWSAPRPILGDNEVFDLTPAVAAIDGGALAAWSRFDGSDYRVVTARYDGRRWREQRVWPGRGAAEPRLTRLGGHLHLLYGAVEPPAWHLVSFDRRGEEEGEETAPWTLYEPPPPLRLESGRVVLEPAGEAAAPAGERPAQGSEGASSFRYMAFGDSITAGTGCTGAPYPSVLDDAGYLNCAANDCQVVNRGVGGERTGQGVTRIQQVLANEGPWDVVILMEGTNDICFDSVSNNAIQNNLGLMEGHAADAGTETLHTTIVDMNPEGDGPFGDEDFPCPEDLGREDDMTIRIRDNLANVDTDTGYRWWANTRSNQSSPPEVTGPQPLCDNSQSCMNTHFADWGHPDCSGYQRLADEVRDGVFAKPVPGLPTAVEPSGTTADTDPIFRWSKELPRDATWYQFQLEGPAGADLWSAETELCAAWQCTLYLGELPVGNYTWRVRGRNARGRSAWRETTFTIVAEAPGAPTPLSPDTVISDDRPALVWRAEIPQLADGYQTQVFDGGGLLVSNLQWTAASVCVGNTCSVEPFALGDPLPDGEYTWRVRGSNAQGPGPWSETLAFEVLQGLIFFDGFESGDVSAWSAAVP